MRMLALTLSTAIAFLLVVTASVLAHEASPEKPASTAAPATKCEVRQPVWCIQEGASDISHRFEQGGAIYRTWTIRGFFRRAQPLVVLEPYGCRTGLSDTVEALGFDEHLVWSDKVWNRMRVRLKNDSSCDLELLIPQFKDDASGEAYFQGLALIRSCTTASCDGPTLGPLRGQFEKNWRESN